MICRQKFVECTVLGSASGAEAEDSSYDSDYEAEEQPEGQLTSPARSHADVSRTASDTLAAEFAEYVTVQSIGAAPPSHAPGMDSRARDRPGRELAVKAARFPARETPRLSPQAARSVGAAGKSDLIIAAGKRSTVERLGG